MPVMARNSRERVNPSPGGPVQRTRCRYNGCNRKISGLLKKQLPYLKKIGLIVNIEDPECTLHDILLDPLE
jgi:hypothetical protein